MKLLGDRIAVIVDVEEATEQKSLLIVPSAEPVKKNTGIVSFAGPGRILSNGELNPCTVQVGDHVLFTPFAGTTVSINEQEYLVLREGDITAVLA